MLLGAVPIIASMVQMVRGFGRGHFRFATGQVATFSYDASDIRGIHGDYQGSGAAHVAVEPMKG